LSICTKDITDGSAEKVIKLSRSILPYTYSKKVRQDFLLLTLLMFYKSDFSSQVNVILMIGWGRWIRTGGMIDDLGYERCLMACLPGVAAPALYSQTMASFEGSEKHF